MEKELRAAGLKSVANGRFEIIIKTSVYRFSGSYTVHDNDEPVVAEFSQFDVLFSIDGENHLVHPADVHQLERLFRVGVPRQIKIKARIIKRNGVVCVVTADGHLRDIREAPEIDTRALEHARLKRAESSLRSNFQLLKQAEELAAMGSWEFDYVTETFSWSEGMYRIFEKENGQLVVPEIYIDCVVDRDRPIARELIDSFRKNPSSFDRTFNIKVEGKTKFIKVKADVINDQNGQPEKLVGMDVDITAIMTSENALAEQVRFISGVVNTIPSMISVINIDTREPEYINTAPFENEGFGKEVMNNLTVEDRKNLIHKDDQRLVNDYFQSFLDMSDEQVNVMEYRANSRGTWQWYLAHGRVFSRNTEGRPTHCVNVVQNISSQKNNEATIHQGQRDILEMKEELALTAENKYKILFNSIDEGFCIVEVAFDSEGRAEDYLFVEVNPAFGRQTGLEDVVGKTMKSLRPHHEQFWFDTYGHVALSGDPISFVNVAHELGGRWYESYAFPVTGKTKNRVAILFHDISERRQFELNLQGLNAKLRELDVVKTNFFSNVSHEFRTPLTLMINPLEELITQSSVEADSKELANLQMVHRNALRLQKMINMLLDFFRIESGRVEAKFEETDLSELTADIASNFRSAIEAAGLKFIVKKLSPPQKVFVDRDLWEKIVLNLISNAFKFTHKGTIRVSIVSNRDMLQLKVRDTGIGISQQDIRKLFDRFVRIEGVKARTNEGSGIGLALVKELVKLHGGTVEVESEEGKGSLFTVSIPTAKVHLPLVTERPAAEALPPVKEAFVEEIKAWLPNDKNGTLIDSTTDWVEEKPSVMVVDDNADMREYLLKILTDHFVVIPAENGAHALRYLANVRPDLILTDVLMPETNGITLLTELRRSKVYSNIPIVLLSARAGESLKSEAIQLGADDYIAKPFSTRELIATLSARIEVSRARAKTEKEVIRKQLELEQTVLDRTKELIRSREDLTQANESLKQKNYELMAMNEELTNFAFIASHDLREPLRKVTLFTNELSGMTNEPMPEKAREYANKIFNSVARMNALLDDVLDFSKMRSRSLLKYTQVDLSRVVENVRVELSQLIMENEGVVEAGALPTISGNAVQIYNLFENLIANGIKFRRPERGNIVKIRSEVLKKGESDLTFAASSSDYLKIVFSDNGIGFEPQYTEKIFHMFQRLHRANEYNGTGMGLAISKKVMQNHKGYIFADGDPGEGAIFSCYFPLEQ